MRRYWIEPEQLYKDETQQEKVSFKGEQFHHIFEVCRQHLGSHFEVIHPNRKAYLIQVVDVQKKIAFGRVIESRKIPELPLPHIHLALSFPRFPVFDSVLEKMVEMGVASLHPFFSDLSFIRDQKNFSPQKMNRWEKIITSSTQQCGRGELMELHPPEPWAEIFKKINQSPESLCLFSYEGESTLGVKEFLNSKANANKPKNLWIIVGSEGGFSTREVGEFESLGFHPVTLGTQVLRVETACMTLVSALKYEFDLMR